MLPSHWTEILGYLASLLIAASLMMSNIRRLRWANLVGSSAFSAYGALLHAWPVFGVNAFIACVNVYYLVKMSRRKDFFTLLPTEGSEALVKKFVLFYGTDIRGFFPNSSVDSALATKGFFVLRNLLPVGLFCYQPGDNDDICIELDYVIPEYRDNKNAEFLYETLNDRFATEGKRRFVVRSEVIAHQKYLKGIGFEPLNSQRGLYQKVVI